MPDGRSIQPRQTNPLVVEPEMDANEETRGLESPGRNNEAVVDGASCSSPTNADQHHALIPPLSPFHPMGLPREVGTPENPVTNGWCSYFGSNATERLTPKLTSSAEVQRTSIEANTSKYAISCSNDNTFSSPHFLDNAVTARKRGVLPSNRPNSQRLKIENSRLFEQGAIRPWGHFPGMKTRLAGASDHGEQATKSALHHSHNTNSGLSINFESRSVLIDCPLGTCGRIGVYGFAHNEDLKKHMKQMHAPSHSDDLNQHWGQVHPRPARNTQAF